MGSAWGLVEILVGTACIVAAMPGIANNDAMAGLIYLAGGVIFVSTVSRGFEKAGKSLNLDGSIRRSSTEKLSAEW